MNFTGGILNNIKVLKSQLLLALFLVFTTFFEVHALTIVRMEMRLATIITNVDMELYDEHAPYTVANFLGYVQRGDYDNILFNRSVPGFVVQGGAYSYVPKFDLEGRFVNANGDLEAADPVMGELAVRPMGETYFVDANDDGVADTDPSGAFITRVNDGLRYTPVDTTKLPVLNEPGISNLRGTLSMAKLADLPDSATREWFVNIADNSQNLDSANGGFTVFGSVMGSGMDYFDVVNSQTLHTFAVAILGSGFSSFPVINGDGTLHSGFGVVLNENVARVNSAKEILHIDLSNTDFGEVALGNAVQRTITVTNRWSNPVTIGQFEDLDLLAAPYSVITDTCSGATIQSASACIITIELNASAPGVFSDAVDISFVTPDISNVTIELSGFSSSGTNPDISVNKLVDFGAGLPDTDVLTETLLVRNLGMNPLTITSISEPSGVDAASFSMTHDCVSLSLGATCAVTLKFNAILAGPGIEDKIAEITINTNDPDASSVTVNLTAFGGDGNNDNVLDIKQTTVTSLQLTDGGYITIAVDDNGGYILNNVSEISNPSSADAPNVSFSNGFISADVYTLTSNFDVAVILPVGSNVNTYYQYGVTSTNNVPHWYEFMFNGLTGAQIYKNVTLTAPDGTNIQRDMIMIRYQDGARGDNDLTINGSVTTKGAAGYKNITNDVGKMQAWTMILMILSIFMLRLRLTS